MRVQFSISIDGRVSGPGESAERINQIIDSVTQVAEELGLPLDLTDSLVAEMPGGISLAYQRHRWRKEEFSVYHEGQRVEVVYRHNGNGTITYLGQAPSNTRE